MRLSALDPEKQDSQQNESDAESNDFCGIPSPVGSFNEHGSERSESKQANDLAGEVDSLSRQWSLFLNITKGQQDSRQPNRQINVENAAPPKNMYQETPINGPAATETPPAPAHQPNAFDRRTGSS